MEHIAAFLLVVGCSPDLAACREIPAPTAIYETIEDCAAERPGYAAVHQGDAPRVFVECFEVDPQLTETDAEIVWDVGSDGKLTAWVEPYASEEVLVASNRGDGDAHTGLDR